MRALNYNRKRVSLQLFYSVGIVAAASSFILPECGLLTNASTANAAAISNFQNFAAKTGGSLNISFFCAVAADELGSVRMVEMACKNFSAIHSYGGEFQNH